jgi:cysteine peptidase C11 family protein
VKGFFVKNHTIKISSYLLFAALFILLLPGVVSAAEWTFMIYMDGDNSLESQGINDINELETVGSDSNINIVVMFDRIPQYSSSNGDWTDTRRGLIIKDTDTSIISSTLTSVGEKNMGDAATLTEFTNWAITNYPANKYALILWNHGYGWRRRSEITKLLKNKKTQINLKDICVDDTSNDSLLTSEIGQALDAVSTHLDLIGMDACTMQMMEVAYEIRMNGDILVASEQNEPLPGWPYDLIMSDLSADPAMNADTLSQSIVTRYGESYNGEYTQSAVKLPEIGNLATTLDTLAGAIIASDSEWATMLHSRSMASFFSKTDFRDLSTFINEMATKSRDSGVLSAANQAKTVFNSVLLHNHSAPDEGGTGLSIYLTAVGSTPLPEYSASNIKFANDTRWDELLNTAASKVLYDDRFEPDNTPAEATQLNLNSTEKGLCIKDDDWFKISFSSGSRISIVVAHNYKNGNLELELRDKNNIVIASSRTSENEEIISKIIENEDDYYIRVFGLNSAQNYYYALYVYETETSSIYECIEMPYTFNNLSGDTLASNLSDDDSVNIPIGFDFNFFDEFYTSLKASTNGYITFGFCGSSYNNLPMPIPTEPTAVIAPLWDDLKPPEGAGGIYYKTTGVAGKRKLSISWINYTHSSSPAGSGDVKFQVVLSEEGGTIRFNYLDVDFSDTDYNFGNSATIGILDNTGKKTLLFSYNETEIKNKMSLVFKKKSYTPVKSKFWNQY